MYAKDQMNFTTPTPSINKNNDEPQNKKIKLNIKLKNSKCSSSIIMDKKFYVSKNRFTSKPHNSKFKINNDPLNKKYKNTSEKMVKKLISYKNDTIRLFSILNEKCIKLEDFARNHLDISNKKISKLLKLTLHQIRLNKLQKNLFYKIHIWVAMHIERENLIRKKQATV